VSTSQPCDDTKSGIFNVGKNLLILVQAMILSGGWSNAGTEESST
jgi:hypothetical protein